MRALRDRAERAERERHLLAEQARADERARIAGEMHDVVTHRVSLMVLQAGALSITATDQATKKAAEELRAAGCQALDELRDLVGILRTEPEGADPTPSVSGLAALISESAAVGTPAELVEDGDRSLASPVVGRTAYRMVREGLTNARKHAPGSQVLVQVELRRVGGAGRGPQHPADRPAAGSLRPGRARFRTGPRTSGSGSRSCTARCWRGPTAMAGSGSRPCSRLRAHGRARGQPS